MITPGILFSHAGFSFYFFPTRSLLLEAHKIIGKSFQSTILSLDNIT
jgi:hypothetical protein